MKLFGRFWTDPLATACACLVGYFLLHIAYWASGFKDGMPVAVEISYAMVAAVAILIVRLRAA